MEKFMAREKILTQEEQEYFVNSFNESNQDLISYCKNNNIEVYDMKRWKRKYSKAKAKQDAGLTMEEAVVLKEKEKALEPEVNNNIAIFNGEPKNKVITYKKFNDTVPFHHKSKKVPEIISEEIIEDDALAERITFRKTREACCCKILDLVYSETNRSLIHKIMEVL